MRQMFESCSQTGPSSACAISTVSACSQTPSPSRHRLSSLPRSCSSFARYASASKPARSLAGRVLHSKLKCCCASSSSKAAARRIASAIAARLLALLTPTCGPDRERCFLLRPDTFISSASCHKEGFNASIRCSSLAVGAAPGDTKKSISGDTIDRLAGDWSVSNEALGQDAARFDTLNSKEKLDMGPSLVETKPDKSARCNAFKKRNEATPSELELRACISSLMMSRLCWN